MTSFWVVVWVLVAGAAIGLDFACGQSVGPAPLNDPHSGFARLENQYVICDLHGGVAFALDPAGSGYLALAACHFVLVEVEDLLGVQFDSRDGPAADVSFRVAAGSPTRAVLEDMDGHTVQCYRMSTGTKNARVQPVSADIYDWGWAAA